MRPFIAQLWQDHLLPMLKMKTFIITAVMGPILCADSVYRLSGVELIVGAVCCRTAYKLFASFKARVAQR